MAKKHLTGKPKTSLTDEIEELRSRLKESEDTLNAIRNGEVDSIIVSGAEGEKIFTLTSAETPYRIFLEEMEEGAVTLNSNGIILYCNQRFSTLLSEPLGQIVGSDFIRFISPNDKQKFSRVFKKGSSGRASEVISFMRNGDILPLHLKLSFRALSPDTASEVCIIASDVTGMKEIQQKLEGLVKKRTSDLVKANAILQLDLQEITNAKKNLQESENRFRAFMDNSPAIAWIKDEKGRHIYVSKAYEERFSVKLENLSGKTDFEIWPHNIAQVLNDNDQAVLTDGKTHHVIEEVRSSDGIVSFWDTSKFIINDIEGHKLVAGSGVDITERLKSDEKLQLTLSRFYQILSSLHNGILLVNDNNNIEFANQTFCDIFGFTDSPNDQLNLSADQMIEKIRNSYIDPDKEVVRIREIVNLGQPVIGEDIVMRNGRTYLRDFIPIYVGEKLYGRLWSHIDITERKQAEDALRESEAQFRSILTNSQDVIYRMNLKTGRYEYISPSCEKVVGYAPDELMALDKESSLAMVHPDYVAVLKQAQEITEVTGKGRAEYPQVTKNGDYHWLSNHMSIIKDSTGKPLYCDGNIRDITEHKHALEMLRESEQTKSDLLKKLNQAQEIAIIGSWDWNLQTNKVWWSDETYRIFGVSPENYVPGFESNGEFIHPDDLAEYGNVFDHSIKTGEPLNFDTRLITQEGLLKYCNVKGSVIFDNDHKPIHFVGTIMDITERTKAQNTIRDAQSKLNIALENGNIGVWEWDLKTDEMIWDERLEKMFGLETGTFGKTFQTFENLVNEEDMPHIKTSIKEALEKDLPFETIYRTGTNTGKTKFISSKGLVSKDNEGKPRSMSGVCFDVTGLKEGTEILISKLNEELLRSNKELQSFAYVASHDLQEPLRMVTSFTQLLSKQYEDKLDDKAREYINFAVDGATRMYDLLNGLLAYSRIQTKGQEFKRVNINNVLRSVTKNLSLLINERRTEINAVKLPVVYADESQMILLFQNLISNSIKFSTKTPKIFISVKNKKDQFVFSVKDEGIGIEPQYFKKIFLIYQRLVPKDKYEGTGIGLAICRRIVERHGGKIWVESVLKKGSTFFFTIPKKTYF